MWPTGHRRWPAFAATLTALRFNPRLLTSDAEWSNHGGPSLWALFLEGVEAEGRDGSRLRRLETQERRGRETRAARSKSGRCVRCGGGRDNETRMCDSCRARHAAWKANYRNRLRGLT